MILKLAFKNLWSRRRTNVWLFLEIVAVTVVGWIIINPLVVGYVDGGRPLGYDIDRLAYVRMRTYPKSSARFTEEWADSASRSKAFREVLSRIRSNDKVESLTIEDTNLPSIGGMMTYTMYPPGDTVGVAVTGNRFYTATDYFTTMGIKAVEGSPSAQELENRTFSSGEVILSRSVAERFFPGENAVGKEIAQGSHTLKVVGVIENMRMKPHLVNDMVRSSGVPLGEPGASFGVLIRLKSGVDASEFIHDEVWQESVSLGNLYVDAATTVEEDERGYDILSGRRNSRVVGLTLTAFFLAVMVLGVSGLFWMLTRKRSEEAGILKAFGARSSFIERLMMLEGVIIAVAGWLAGCLIYLQYVIMEGFNDGREEPAAVYPDDWISHFWEHFAVISLVILALILVTVVIGTWLPARKVAAVSPVDALKEE